MLRALIGCTHFLKRTIIYIGFMNVILVHRVHQYGVDTHEAIFRVVKTRIQIQL